MQINKLLCIIHKLV